MSSDLLKVVLDYKEARTKKQRKKVDTGLFKKIYKGVKFYFIQKLIERASEALGFELKLEGTPLNCKSYIKKMVKKRKIVEENEEGSSEESSMSENNFKN